MKKNYERVVLTTQERIISPKYAKKQLQNPEKKYISCVLNAGG